MRVARSISLAGSWWLTAALLLAFWAVYLLFSFGRNPYPDWVSFIFHSRGGILLSVLLAANLTLASIRIALARFQRPELSARYVRTMDIHAEIPLPDDEAVRRAAKLLQKHVGAADIALQGMRHITGQWSFLPGTVFRAGVVLVIISLMVSAHSRQTYDTEIREGETKEVLGAPVTVAAITADLPADLLMVGDDGIFVLHAVSARLAAGGREATITPGFPSRINGHWYRIRHVGFSQELAISLRGERTAMTAHLDLLPPGRSSIVSLPSAAAFATFSLAPDRTITKGLATGRQYDLTRPVYQVVVQQGKQRGNGPGSLLRPGEQARIGPARVALGQQGLFVSVQIVSDPGLLFLYGGLLMTLAGLVSLLARFFWYEREFAVVVHDRTLLAGARDEFFGKWGLYRFEKWKEDLLRRE